MLCLIGNTLWDGLFASDSVTQGDGAAVGH